MNDLKIFVNYLNNWSHNQITKISNWNVHRFKSFAEYCKLQYGSAVGIWYLSNLLYWTAWKSYLLLRTLCTCQFNDAPLYPFDSSISRNSMQIWRTPDHLCENDSPLSHFCDWHFGFLTHMWVNFYFAMTHLWLTMPGGVGVGHTIDKCIIILKSIFTFSTKI